MKKIVLLILFAGLVHGKSFVTNTAGNPIGHGYDVNRSNSLVATGVDGGVRELCVFNDTGTIMAMNVSTESGAEPLPDVNEIYLPPSATENNKFCRHVRPRGRIFLRAVGGASVTSGNVYGDID
jgi:hypothetical protein